MPVITNIEDLRILAKARVPRMFYDYADSGSWTESTYRANSADFQAIKLRQRVAKTIDYVKSFKPAQFEGADARDVTFPVGPTNQMTLKGQPFLSGFSFPNFYFHATTAYDILRQNGFQIGKQDFLLGVFDA